jgi:NFU1 iron-sulfur cluster scaffold homolog, mitochondrial
MFIETQDTPNPHTVKFLPGVAVLQSGIKSFGSEDDTTSSPLATSLFKISGVKGIFLSQDFISITKSADEDWAYLRPLVLSTIVDHFVSGLPVYIEANTATRTDADHDSITKEIIELIETRVRPAVANDGGDIVFQDFQDGVVYVKLHGACSGCPSSTVTLKDGIENMLKHYVPEVQSVEAV